MRVAIVTGDEAAALTLHDRLTCQGQCVFTFPDLEAMWQLLDVRAVDLLLLDLRDPFNAGALDGASLLHLPSFTIVATFGRPTSVLPPAVVFTAPPSAAELSALLHLALRQRWPHADLADYLH
jgi:hypothetical protein